MFDYMKRSIGTLLVNQASKKALLTATYNDSLPSTDGMYDECILILLGRRGEITQEEALCLIPGRLRDDWSENVVMKVMLLFRALIISHYTSTEDIRHLFGARSIISTVGEFNDKLVTTYCDALDYWVKHSTRRGDILNKDHLAKLLGLWGDVNVDVTLIGNMKLNELFDSLDVLFALCKKLLSCFILFSAVPQETSHQGRHTRRRPRRLPSSDGIKRTHTVMVIPRQEFSQLVLQTMFETYFDVGNLLTCAKGFINELSVRSKYRLTAMADYEDFIELIEEYQLFLSGVFEIQEFLLTCEVPRIREGLQMKTKVNANYIDQVLIDTYRKCVTHAYSTTEPSNTPTEPSNRPHLEQLSDDVGGSPWIGNRLMLFGFNIGTLLATG